ncbi:MAG TPA: protelomerase family protein [Nodularia sp. (in: cyanobacteria)]|nr:protelomerase family protein [Nodularia sp. (in: cyanobacteria)]
MKGYERYTSKVRTQWVKGWAEDFLKGLDNVPNKKDETIESYCQEKKAEFEQICIAKSRKSDDIAIKNSQAANMTSVRTAIKEWEKTVQLNESNSYPVTTKSGVIQQHIALLIMNYASDFHRERQEPTNARKQEQRSNLEPINCVDEYIELIDKLLQSPDHRELTVGLIASTGRRPSEIWKTAQFTQCGQFEVEFLGQIKAKGEEREAYKTYTLVESYKVVDALAKLRRMPEIKSLKKATLAEIDSGRNNKMNSKVKEYFAELINPPMGEVSLSAKNLRASYAAITVYLFCPWQKSTNQFITERLGHVSDATATNYEDYQVCDKNGKPLTRGAWVERISEDMLTSKESKIVNTRLRMTEATREAIDDTDFLPYGDLVSRFQELIRLAKIGKDFEDGKLVKEVVIMQNSAVENVEVMDSVEVDNAVEAANSIEVVEVVQTKPAKKGKKDLSEISNTELFGSNTPFSTKEKIRRAVDAVKTYNERQAEKKYWWAINTKVLTDLTGCRSAAIKAYMDSEEGRLNVTDYNLHHGLGYQHNKGKGNVTEFVKLV